MNAQQPIGCGTLLLAAAVYFVLYVLNTFALGYLAPHTGVPAITEGVELLSVAFYPIPFFILHAFFVTSRYVSVRLREGSIPAARLGREIGYATAVGLFFGALLLLRLSGGDAITTAALVAYPVLFAVSGALGSAVIGRLLARISEDFEHRDAGRATADSGRRYTTFLITAAALFAGVAALAPAVFNGLWTRYLELRHDVILADLAPPLLSFEDVLFQLPSCLVVGTVVISMLQLRGSLRPPTSGSSLVRRLGADFLRGAVLGLTIEGGYRLSLIIYDTQIDPLALVVFRTLIFSLCCALAAATLSALMIGQRRSA